MPRNGEPLSSLTFKVFRWTIALLAAMPLAMLAIALAGGREQLDFTALVALFLLSGLPIAVYYVFRWLALLALALVPFLND